MLFRALRRSKNRSAEQIEQLLQHLGMLAELSEEGMLVVDSKGFVHFVNTAWARMHGYRTSRELIGKEIRGFHTAEQMKSELGSALGHLRHLGQFAGQVGHVRKDGTTFPAQMKMRTLKDGDGETVGLLVRAVDMSTGRHAGHSVERTRDEAEAVGTGAQDTECPFQKEDSEAQLREELAVLSAANEEHRSEIAKLEQVERELQEYIDRLEGEVSELKTVREESAAQQTEDEYLDDSATCSVVLNTEKLKAVADMAKRLR